jgi:hypothetical protein
MNKIIFLSFFFLTGNVFAQNDDTALQISQVIVHQDERLDILGEKEAQINWLNYKLSTRTAIGYRLQVLSTNDRELAMKTKTELLQKFPEQKVYMLFRPPYIKLRFGNFKTKEEAERYRKHISRMLEDASFFLISERIEVKPEELLEEEQ